MRRLIPLRVVAEALDKAPAYLRRIAADQGRPEHGPGCTCTEHRRYPRHVHERFPLFFKEGRGYYVTLQTLTAHLERRGKKWEPKV